MSGKYTAIVLKRIFTLAKSCPTPFMLTKLTVTCDKAIFIVFFKVNKFQYARVKMVVVQATVFYRKKKRKAIFTQLLTFIMSCRLIYLLN